MLGTPIIIPESPGRPGSLLGPNVQSGYSVPSPGITPQPSSPSPSSGLIPTTTSPSPAPTPAAAAPAPATPAPATPAPTPSPATPALIPPVALGTGPVVNPPVPGVNLATSDVSNIGAGVNSSVSSLLPTGFNIGQLTAPAQPDATTPGAATYVSTAAPLTVGPTNWNVTSNQTVAGQYASLMATGNPAIQAAMEASLRANAAAGGRNSTMAQSAATLAGSQVALTIAQQDAQVYAAAGQYNATQANAFATQQNQFVQNSILSQQNFNQGVAMLKDQTTQANAQLYAQVQASAATASVNIKTTLANTQISTNATLAQMDKQFAQANSEAQTNYGMQVQMGYLSSLNTQQNSLMGTIGSINSNPNITSSQASAAVTSAVQQFNSFMTMNNAYYASMMPSPTTGVGTFAPPVTAA